MTAIYGEPPDWRASCIECPISPQACDVAIGFKKPRVARFALPQRSFDVPERAMNLANRHNPYFSYAPRLR
jgi:hypothetical protein